MQKFLLISTMLLSFNAFSQTLEKPDPNSPVNAEEQINGLPGAGTGSAYSVRAKKRSVKMPKAIAPVENITPANCSESLGGKGSATYTACEAGKKTR